MKLIRRIPITAAGQAIEWLVTSCPELSKGRLKDAMNKGAVQLVQGKQHKRLRRAQTVVAVGNVLELHYDDDILQRQASAPVLVADERGYSVWYKPAGLLSQGNEWGDHLALLRLVEQHFGNQRPVFLLHRLDREASGLVLIAHQKTMAATLSQLIQQHQIKKTYRITVLGHLDAALHAQGEITLPLDGKSCCTRFTLNRPLQSPARSVLDVDLISGRKHQIRRHFAAVGHPVMGDPQYGQGNQDPSGLALQAVRVAFTLPRLGLRQYELPAELLK